MVDETAVGNKFAGNLLTVGTTTLQLPAALLPPFRAIRGVRLFADSTNSNSVYIGSADVSATNGFKLAAGQGEFIPLASLDQLFFIAGASGQKIWYWVV